MSVANVMKKIKSNNVKFVDFRFSDTKGKEQHVTVPISAFDKSKFTDGHAFDGSSVAGWKGINASDMLLSQTLIRLILIHLWKNQRSF